MQARGLRFVTDRHLGPVAVDEFVYGTAFCGAHVGGCDDAEFRAALFELFERGVEEAQPGQRTNAQRRSTVLAGSISVRSSAARFGSSLLLVSRAESLSRVLGRRRLRRLRVSGGGATGAGWVQGRYGPHCSVP